MSLGSDPALATPISFTYAIDNSGALPPEQARLRAASSPLVSELRTNRAEQPHFLVITSNQASYAAGEVLEFPSKHIQNISIWAYNSDGRLIDRAQADRRMDSLHLTQVGSGFAYTISTESALARSIVIRTTSVGPALLSISKYQPAEFRAAQTRYERIGALLLGSMTSLAVFCGMIAILTRDRAFAICSIWLMFSMLSAGLSGGYENTWLPFLWDIELHGELKRTVNAAHAIASVYLFDSLFGSQLRNRRATKALRGLKFIVLLLAPAAIIFPVRTFLPIMWAIVGAGAPFLLYLLIDLALKSGSIAARWYLMSWGFSLLGVISEILNALSIPSLTAFGLNNQTGAVISGLLTGITLSEKLRTERARRVKAQARSVAVLKKFEETYNSMPIGLFRASGDGKISLFNPAFARIFGLPPEATTPHRLTDLLGTDGFYRLANATESEISSDIEFESIGTGKTKRWYLARVQRSEDALEGSIQDVTRRKAAEHRLKHLVTHDSLTDLLNRRGIEAEIAAAINKTIEGRPCAVGYANLDRFKVINDLHGHGVGDLILREVGARISATLRPGDKIGRIGDSFVLILDDCPDYAIRGLTERVRDNIASRPIEVSERGISVTVSIGILELRGGCQPNDAMAAADQACAEAKKRGRNCVVVLKDQDAALKSHLEELRMVANLQSNEHNERYFLEFQPIVALRHADRSLNYEVLIRMRGEDGSVVAPGKFIGAAERHGMMAQIDRWVLRNVLEWLDTHPEHREQLDFATINLSGASLNDARFIEDAFSMIAEHPSAMQKLCFEITESVALHDLGSTRRFVDRVRLYGAKLALDDFGAGYTSFNYLKEIPADFIKIDGSFVKDINRNPANFSITRTIVDLTHELGMKSIAEWAETADTVKTLISIGVDYGQGFVLARPMDKRVVTCASSCIDLIRDPSIAELVASKAASLHPA